MNKFLNLFDELQEKILKNSLKNNLGADNPALTLALENKDFESLKKIILANKTSNYINDRKLSAFIVNPHSGVEFLNKFLPFLVAEKINIGSLTSFEDKIINPVNLPLYLAPIVHKTNHQIKKLYLMHLLGNVDSNTSFFKIYDYYNASTQEDNLYENFCYVMCFNPQEAVEFFATVCAWNVRKNNFNDEEQHKNIYDKKYLTRRMEQYIQIFNHLSKRQILHFTEAYCYKLNNLKPEEAWQNADSAVNFLLFILKHIPNFQLKKQDFIPDNKWGFIDNFKKFKYAKLINNLEQFLISNGIENPVKVNKISIL